MSGTPALAWQGGTFYVDGDRSENGVGSEADPFNTLSSIPVQEDATVFVAGVLHEAVQWTGSRRGTTVLQWPGKTQSELRGDVIVPPEEWTADGNGLWHKVTSATPCSVVWNWDRNVDVLGRHYGHLSPVASLADCRAQPASWYFEPIASKLFIHPPLGALPPDQGDVYAWVRSGSGLTIGMGERLTIDGLHFRLWSDSSSGNGYGLKINDGLNSTVSNCLFEDCGYHSAGFVGERCEGNRFIACVARGLHGRSNHFVFYSQTEDLTRCEAIDCVAHLYGILDWRGGSLDSSDRIGGYYTHTGGSATVRDVEFRRCTSIGYEDSIGNSFGTGRATAAVQNGRDVNSYPVRFVECIAENCDFANVEGNVAFIRCRLDFRKASRSGGITHSCMIFNRGPSQVAIESSEIITRLDGVNASRAIWAKNSGDVLYLFGVTFYDEFPNAAVRSFLRAGEDVTIVAEQCVFAAEAPSFLTNGATTHTAENFEFANCWYYGIGATRYSTSSELNERTEWASMVDQKGWYDNDPGLSDPPKDLSPAPNGALWRVRVPFSGVSREGISGIAYDGRLGAYQYGWPIASILNSPCPDAGLLKVSWVQAKPSGNVAILYSGTLGYARLQNHQPCPGLPIDLGVPSLVLVGVMRSDSNGTGVVGSAIHRQVCGGYIQMVDLGGCSTTNVIRVE